MLDQLYISHVSLESYLISRMLRKEVLMLLLLPSISEITTQRTLLLPTHAF